MKNLKVNQKNFKEIIKKAINYLKEGKVVVCSTDTVYGLIADATNKKAVKKLFKIKKRKAKNPVPIFVKDLKMARELAEIDKKQEKILKSVWPGKITVVLKRKTSKMKLYGVKKETIALRIPKYKLINELLKKLNHPLTGTSANVSRKPATTKIKEVLRQFPPIKNSGCQPALIIDAGNLKSSKPSTIIGLTGPKPKILRK